ncbi:SDR family oxidoreductase [Pseudobacter ginsenosidimutans]|jgi:3-oxoacyl-[acyl-carrier protein] reductase|uniref:3-oxoacyl-[acyl-carrier protein] reductase n=1 Tax=Pseudobacter ginsenosidimutans TaxID=661488 RepID=A0A4Q7MRR9_9BACT|nr:SDR family oxidoreductase [Pseudobacter ginsenosidimutans]QEC42026.1 SDR family oxidoreductase [Pseudobacter ginsenosidimutans]RZS71138.1 3-oxoacyl-[acyl-carrier protein] reductase [Pseudobacter ginsenosidimutans]
MSTLNNKVILVTGASRGIGASVAKELAKGGAKLIVNYAGGKAEAEKTVEEIKAAGGDAIALQADVSKSADVSRLFDEAIAHYGRIDVLVNNAGIMITKLLKDTTDEEFTQQFDVNVRGTFNTLREAATKLADKGTIINFSSSTTRLMLPGYGTYVATKGAVEQMTRVFAKEMGARGITVNAVLPGPVNTELFTQGKSAELISRLASLNAFNRIGEPDDIAKVVVFLAGDEAKWISGQTIGINGAMA